MKYNLIAIILLATLGFMVQSCGDDVIDPPKTPDFYDARGAVVSISDVVNGFYDLADIDNAVVGFTVNTQGEDASSVTVYKSFNGGDPVEHASVDDGSTLSIPIDDAINGLGVSIDDLEVGDVITYSFESSTSSGTYKSGTTLDAAMSCSSNLAGTYDVVTVPNGSWCDNSLMFEGESVWEEVSAGVYSIVDFAFGSYTICYNSSSTPDGSLRVNDVCNKITITGASQWDEIYTWRITDISGSSMTIDWENDYGEAGISTLTRQDGSNWPPLEIE